MSSVIDIHSKPLIAIVYMSHSLISDNQLTAELDAIKLVAQKNNPKHQITGKLIYRGHFFLQRLEGPKATVERLYEVIKQDKRHRHVQTIYKGVIDQRYFCDWTQMQVITESDQFEVLDQFFTQFLPDNEFQISDLEAAFVMEFFEHFKD